MPGPRDYTPSTEKRLHALSGNQCAVPACKNKLIARDKETLISKICHIEAAYPGGARYNPQMTNDERRHFDNLILCCDECHLIVDNKSNEAKYPVALLKEWKRNHESKQLLKISANPSLLSDAINAIANLSIDNVAPDEDSLQPFKIEDKIQHNAIVKFKSLIEEYKVFHAKINSLYDELEAQGSFKKENLLRNIRQIYLKTRDKYINGSADVLAAIRSNADSIIEDIEDQLIKSVEAHVYREDIAFGTSLIMVDAFMRCKILEEPPKNVSQ